MTILNAYASRGAVFVCVDTLRCTLDTPPPLPSKRLQPGPKVAPSSKIFPVAHANLVVAARGSHGIPLMLSMYCLVHGLDLDGLVDAMPEVLPLCIADVTQQLRAKGIDPSAPGLDLALSEVVIAGWSKRDKRVALWQFNEWTGSAGREQAVAIAPWQESWGNTPAVWDRADFIEIAKRQCVLARRDAPHVPWGGHLIVAEITERRMTIETACELSEADAPRS